MTIGRSPQVPRWQKASVPHCLWLSECLHDIASGVSRMNDLRDRKRESEGERERERWREGA